MRIHALRSALCPIIPLTAFVLAACSSAAKSGPSDGGASDAPSPVTDAATDGGALTDAAGAKDSGPMSWCDAAVCATTTPIQHLVVIIQENHTFDNYFGTYCTAAPGSNPTCTTGPSCCEAAPTNPAQADGGPIALGDGENQNFDPNHAQSCELEEINDGGMNNYVLAAETQTGVPCGALENVAIVPASDAGTSVVEPYLAIAQANTIADHYFQPLAGESNSNDVYFASAKYEFTDNSFVTDSIGSECVNVFSSPACDLADVTIGDVLTDAGVSWAFYSAGYAAAVAASKEDGGCATPIAACPSYDTYPTLDCVYSPTDNPFAYFVSTRDNPTTAKDLTALAADLDGGTLPSVVMMKQFEAYSEHPGSGHKISDGANGVAAIVHQIESSPYASSTLIVVTWDEGGGYYDHIAPPPPNSVDGKPYGTRLPTMFIGPFVKPNAIAHGVMEHSSLVKFIEYNWLGGKTGQLGARDTNVNNIGSALDPAKTFVTVPE